MIGIILIVLNFILGVVSKALFLFYFTHEIIRTTAIIVYVFSWIPLAFGIWLVGKEYADSLRKYRSYRFYHHSLKEGTKKAIDKTKQIKEKVRGKLRKKSRFDS